MADLSFYNNIDLKDGYGSKAGRKNPHGGIDIPASIGTPIPSLTDGEIIENGYSSELGYYTVIYSGNVYWTYCHSNGRGPREVGSFIRVGETVNLVGNKGLVTGPHLHLATATTRRIGYGLPGVMDPLPLVRSALNNGGTEMSSAVLIRHVNGTIGLAADNGDFTVLNDLDEVGALRATGAVRSVGKDGWIQLSDGLIWNKLVAISKRKNGR